MAKSSKYLGRDFKKGDALKAGIFNDLQKRIIALEKSRTDYHYYTPEPVYPEVGLAICKPTKERPFRACKLTYVAAPPKQDGSEPKDDRRGHFKDDEELTHLFDLSFALFDKGDEEEEPEKPAEGSEKAVIKNYVPIPGEIYSYYPQPPSLLIALPVGVVRDCKLIKKLVPGGESEAEFQAKGSDEKFKFKVYDSERYPLLSSVIPKNTNITVAFITSAKRFQIIAARGC